jgi:VCBS repeat-containing protein
VRLVTPPAAGVLAFNTGTDGNPDGTYSFNPAGAFDWLAEGESTTVSFTYEVKDTDGDTDQATVTIVVTGTNDAAVISGDVTGAVVEAGSDNNGGTPVATGTLTASDVDNAPDSFQAVATATAGDNGYGSYTMAADGSWTYTLDNANAAVEALDAGDTLTDSFTVYTIDGTAQQVTVTINGAADVTVNQAPVAVDDVVDSVVGSGDAAIITFETYYIEYNAFTGFYRVTTDEGFLFTDNGAGSYQQGNTVGGPNVSIGDWGVDYSNALYSYGVEFNAYDTSTFTLPIVMTRVDGGDFSLTSANITSYDLGGNPEAAFHATVTGYLDGQQVAQQSFDVPDANLAEIVNNMVALADPGFSEVDRVEYWLTAENNGYIDSYYDSSSDTYIIEQYQFAYQWIDNIHTGAAISRPTEGRVLRGIDVLANDTDDGPQGDLSIAQFSATSALGAVVTLNPDGTLNYDPTAVATINALGAGQSLVDTFTYVAQDAFGALSNTATVSLDVQGVNDTPVAHDDVLSPVQSLTNEDTSVQIASATLLANDTDVDNGHVLNVGSVSATSALGAAVSIDGNGVITYDPTVSGILAALGENEFANDSFVYTAVDEYGASSQATASLRIAGAYDAPTVQNNAPTVAGSLNGGTIYVWAGADVPDGDSGGPQFNLSPDALPAVVHALDNATDADHDPLSVESFAVVAGNKIGIWNDVGYFGGMNINSSQAISFDAGANTFALDPNAYALQGLRTGESATVTVAYNVSDGQAATPDSVSWTLVGTNDVSLVGMLIA